MKMDICKIKRFFVNNIKIREETNGTGLEEHIAMPHAKGTFVNKHGIAILRVTGDGFDFNASDAKLSKLFFMMAVPEEITEIPILK